MSDVDMSLLLGLILAHLTGDFLLQPKTWVEERYRLKYRSPRLVQHALVHGLLAMGVLLVAAAETHNRGAFTAIFGGLAIGTSHWLIDLGKAQLSPQRLRWFLIDQSLHLVIILGIWLAWLGSLAPLGATLSWLVEPRVLGLAAAYLLVMRPLSIVIAMVMNQWSQQLEETGTLAAAGARIGMLERFLVLTLVLLDQLIVVGFLLAAKSVLRFGDLHESRDRKLTEYVLLGTLLSVSISLVLGMLLKMLVLEG